MSPGTWWTWSGDFLPRPSGYGLPPGTPSISVGTLWRRVRSGGRGPPRPSQPRAAGGPAAPGARAFGARGLHPALVGVDRRGGRAGSPARRTRGWSSAPRRRWGARAPRPGGAPWRRCRCLRPPRRLGPRLGRAGASGGERGLGVVGRIRPEKGQGDLAEAWRSLAPRFPAWRAVLVGRVAPADARHAEPAARHRPAGAARGTDRRRPGVPGPHCAGAAVATGVVRAGGAGGDGRRLLCGGGEPRPPSRAGGAREDGVSLIRRGMRRRWLPSWSRSSPSGRAEAVGRAAAAEVRARHGVAQEVAGLRALYAGLERRG